MRYSIEPRDMCKICVKEYGFLSFAKNMNNNYSQKRLNSAKKSTTGAIKIASKRANQKAAEATGDLIGNRIADKITNLSKKISKEFRSQNEHKIEISKERHISQVKRQEFIDELRLVK